MIRKKILLLGDFNVGKTSLIRRYIENTFEDKYLTTIGVKISKKTLSIDEKEYELIIWDVEGRTPQKKVPESYLLGASGAIFVADCNREETVKDLKEHIERFLSLNPDAKYVKAYNKSDLLTDQQQELFVLDGSSFFTSAKDGLNVNCLFSTLAKEMLL
ncbi:Rab family GTPase [Sulfurovum sp. NBC37-1]|uniref:Rab family GTPase n=1 Tax=Sulfurovum sp. (strain NBC37-1) TaxID=387093 RepID=UPI000158751C|nr:Rab family GTPase [Sulfurovum sp. NBC37-1]BAF71795.1 GTP-binding protein [Sulfurovum sp. NBC37-1]